MTDRTIKHQPSISQHPEDESEPIFELTMDFFAECALVVGFVIYMTSENGY